MSVDFSIVMTTYNRSEFLYHTLGSLQRAGLANYNHELIVLNDGDQDESENVCRNSNHAQGLNIRYYHTGQRLQKYWRNMGFAANIGIRLAQSDIVILTNSDIFHTTPNIGPIVEAVQRDPKALSTLNEVYDDQGELVDFLKEDPEINPRKLRRAIQRVKRAPKPRGFYPANSLVPFFMGISRESLLAIGAYDEDFIGPAVEDVDLLDRLQALGHHFVKAPIGHEAIHLYHGRKNIAQLKAHPGFRHNLALAGERKKVMVRNVNRNWGELIDPNVSWSKAPIHLAVWVTSNCNLACSLCNQHPTMEDAPGYSMAKSELDGFLQSCVHRGLHFSTVEITGGEPSLWPLFEHGLGAIVDAGIADDVTFITNGNDAQRVAEIANRHHLRYTVSQNQATREQANTHREVGVGAMFNPAPHHRNPTKMIRYCLPTDCSQRHDKHGRVVRQMLYRQGRIWYCCMAYPVANRLGTKTNPPLSCGFEEDFGEVFSHRWENLPVCAGCLCNNHVWRAMEGNPNASSPSLSQ